MLKNIVKQTTQNLNLVLNFTNKITQSVKIAIKSNTDLIVFIKAFIVYIVLTIIVNGIDIPTKLNSILPQIDFYFYNILIKNSWIELQVLDFIESLEWCCYFWIIVLKWIFEYTDPLFLVIGNSVMIVFDNLCTDSFETFVYFISTPFLYGFDLFINCKIVYKDVSTFLLNSFYVKNPNTYKLNSIVDYQNNIDIFNTLQQPGTNLDYNEFLALNLNQNTHYHNNHFPMYKSRVLITLTVWQYWWWMSFVFVITLFNRVILKLVLSDNIKINPIIHTSIKSNGRWGDLVASIFPIFWCTNILINSNFILKLTENHTETALFTLRVRGKQWYWVYKTSVNLESHIKNQPIIIGRNNKIQPYFSTNSISKRSHIYKKNKFINKLKNFKLDQVKLQNSYKYWVHYVLNSSNSEVKNVYLKQLDRLILNLYCFKNVNIKYSNRFTNTTNFVISNRSAQMRILKIWFNNDLTVNKLIKDKKNYLNKVLNDCYRYSLKLDKYPNLLKIQKDSIYTIKESYYKNTLTRILIHDKPKIFTERNMISFNISTLLKLSSLLSHNELKLLDMYKDLMAQPYIFNRDSLWIHKLMMKDVFKAQPKNGLSHAHRSAMLISKILINKGVKYAFISDLSGNDKLIKNLNLAFKLTNDNSIIKLINKTSNVDVLNFKKQYINFTMQNKLHKLDMQNISPLKYNKNYYHVITQKLSILPYCLFNEEVSMKTAKLFIVQDKYKNKYKHYNRHFLTVQQQPVSIWNLSKKLNIISYENLNINYSKLKKFNDWRQSIVNLFSDAVNLNKPLSILNWSKLYSNAVIEVNKKVQSSSIDVQFILDRIDKNILRRLEISSKVIFEIKELNDAVDKLNIFDSKNSFKFSSLIKQVPNFKKQPSQLTYFNYINKKFSTDCSINKQLDYISKNKVNHFIKTNLKHWGYNKKPIVLNSSKLVIKNRSVNEFYKKKTISKNRLISCHNVLLVPVKTTIAVITNSFDVVHSWFIPGLGIKFDCVPGRSTHYTFRVDKPGIYFGHCAEVCGRFHHHMPIKIVAVPLNQFIYYYNVYYPNKDSKKNN